MSRFMSRFVIFSNYKNPIFQIQRSLRVGPTLAGGAEPGRSRFVIFSNCKRSKTSNPTVFAGGGNSRRWGRAGPGRPRRPGSALPVIFSNHGPKPDLVCEISIPRDVGPAQPASVQSYWSSARPGPSDSRNIFALSLCCVSSSRFRGRNVLVSPRPAASLGRRSLSTIGIRSRV